VAESPPRVLALDVNETLSDLSGLVPRLQEVGAPSHVLDAFLASALRDGFALTAADGYADFGTVARAALQPLLAPYLSPLGRDSRDAAAHIVAGMAELALHDDVRPGLERLHRAGFTLAALTNGSADTARRLLDRGGVAPYIQQCLSVEEVHRWKPAPQPYLMAAERCGVAPDEVMLVAVHPWDVDGAKRARLRAAWINRDGADYPDHMTQPDLACSGFDRLAETLT
jgi:2-haloacid dehalogenase